ncbi:MAG: crossover junction endodeoxyribonuclease RuvC [Chloroflexi bacterium]|nr:crossover junction endodeoxyribonuclease RuvC [Chloroflexota bacterium]
MEETKILGIDPGTLRMGYGIVASSDEQLKMVDYGVLTPSPKEPMAKRLHFLYKGLVYLISRHKPTEVAIEEPFLARNVRSAMAVGEAKAVAILAASNKKVPAFLYTPRRVKRMVAGYGASSKGQVQEMVRIQLGLAETPEPADASDALAVALCHLRERRMARLLADVGESTG